MTNLLKNDMTDWEIIMTMLLENIPFSFVQLNYDEICFIKDKNNDNDQKLPLEIISALENVLYYQHSNYFVGVPCKYCYPTLDQYYENTLNKHNNLTLSNVLINSNTCKTIDN